MTTATTVSRDEWLKARIALLEQEKAFTRERDALAAARRELPRVRVDKDYRFDTEQGERSLADLFDGCGQLVVYHFMYGPDWEVGCKSCSYWADGFNGIGEHLRQRDTRLVAVSRAPLATLTAFRDRMGWRFPWVSSAGSDFNFDFHVSFRKEELDAGTAQYNYRKKALPSDEAPGISCFSCDADGSVYHTYSAYSRGLDIINAAYNILDMTAKGRDEDGLTYPMEWVKLRDLY
ncbi:MAG: DUF899 domain-containing protein [Rhizobiaceae bacterium]